jgi:hypothetical protein
MLFRFKSKSSPDLIMLEVHARHILEMMGKEAVEKGIVCHEDLPEALQRLEQALLVLKHDRNHAQQEPSTEETSLKEPTHDDVSWSQRAQPMLKMIRLALVEKASITWGG